MLSVLFIIFVVVLSIELLAMCIDFFCVIFGLDTTLTSFIVLSLAPFVFLLIVLMMINSLINSILSGGYIG